VGRAVERNERTRKEIANLREQLFSGSSVRESRRAVEQGDNIKILTLVSMIFLPLTFVTVRIPGPACCAGPLPLTRHPLTPAARSLSSASRS